MRNYFFILLILFTITACARGKNKNFVKINDNKIKVEIADTAEKQYLGLSNRENLCADCGMLFKFPDKQIKAFIMRDMNFSLDIIWIDGNMVVGISENLPPEGADYKNFYKSPALVDYVLEVNAGFAEENGIETGDKINF